MTRYIAFLRAINVGGRTVKMDRLCALFAELGFSDVETFIASGNVIFGTKSRSSAALERKISEHLHVELGYEVATFIRSDIEVALIANHDPFSASARASAGALNVALLSQPLAPLSEPKLSGLATAIDDFHVQGREIYWLCRKKQSESTITNAALERALGLRMTIRGLNTLQRLTAKYPPQ